MSQNWKINEKIFYSKISTAICYCYVSLNSLFVHLKHSNIVLCVKYLLGLSQVLWIKRCRLKLSWDELYCLLQLAVRLKSWSCNLFGYPRMKVRCNLMILKYWQHWSAEFCMKWIFQDFSLREITDKCKLYFVYSTK